MDNLDLNASCNSLLLKDSAGLGVGVSAPTQISISDIFADNAYQDCIVLAGGAEVFIFKPKAGSSRVGSGINVVSTFGGDLEISGGISTNNALAGITLNGGVNTIIHDHNASSNSRLSSNANPNIAVGAVSRWRVEGCSLGTIAGGATRTNYGISINASATDFIVSGNDTLNNSTSGINNLAGTSVTQVVSFNI